MACVCVCMCVCSYSSCPLETLYISVLPYGDLLNCGDICHVSIRQKALKPGMKFACCTHQNMCELHFVLKSTSVRHITKIYLKRAVFISISVVTEKVRQIAQVHPLRQLWQQLKGSLYLKKRRLCLAMSQAQFAYQKN